MSARGRRVLLGVARAATPADTQDEGARVLARPSGAMVEQKVSPSVASPCAGSRASSLEPRGAAQWAWNVLRVRPKKVKP